MQPKNSKKTTMVLDFLFVTLLVVAFSAGFQKGIFRSLTLGLSFFLAGCIALMFTPHALTFFDESFGEGHLLIRFMATLLLFLSLVLVIYQLFQTLNNWQGQGVTYLRLLFGGFMLSVMMLFSLAILTGFLQKSGMLQSKASTQSHCLQLIQPMQKMTSVVWEKALVGAETIRDKAEQERGELLSRIDR